MAGREKSGNEILLEQLTKQVAALSSEQKAKEAIIKELNEQIKIAERESASKIQMAKADAEKQVEALRKDIAPLQELKVSCEKLRNEVERLKQEKLDAVSEVKSAKNMAIKEADAVLAKSAAQLAKIEHAINECKARVASL